MMNNQEDFKQMTQNSINVASDVIQAVLHSCENMIKINLEASRKLIKESIETTKDVINTSNPKNSLEKATQLNNIILGNTICNFRDNFETLTKLQTELSTLMQNNIIRAREQFGKNLDNFSNFANNNVAVDSFKNIVDVANQSVSTFSQMAEHMTNVANNSVKNATDVAAESIKKNHKK